MSKVKANKTDAPAKPPQSTSTEKSMTAKKKRKQWMKEKYSKKKPPPIKNRQVTLDPEKAKVKQMLPPKDVQQFSANWKTLQEVRE